MRPKTYRGNDIGEPSLVEPDGVEECNEAEDLWGDTQEALGWEPMDLALELHEDEAQARAESAWAGRRGVE